METEKYQAIVLRSIDYKDNDKLVSLYTLERGKLFASLKGVKKAGAKLKHAGEPFCFGEFMIAGRGSGESATHVITGLSVTEFFFDIASDIDKFYAGSIILEVLDAAGLFDEGNKDLFLESLSALKNLAFSGTNRLVVLLRFMLRVLRISGYRQYPEVVPPAVLNTLRLITEQPEDALGNLSFSENILTDSVYRLGDYISAQFGRKLRSVEIFKKS